MEYTDTVLPLRWAFPWTHLPSRFQTACAFTTWAKKQSFCAALAFGLFQALMR